MGNRLTLTILPPGLRQLRSAQAPPQGHQGGGLQVAQGLPGQFGDHRVRVAEQQNQHPDPGEFSGIDTDHGDGVGHLQ
jgi:hypothetical protein